MNLNTTVVVSVNGFLIIFFIYALLYVFRITPSKTIEPPRPEIARVMVQSPEISEVIEPPKSEVMEVIEPPVPEVTKAMEPQRSQISEVSEVMEPSPDVSEVIEPRLEVSEAIEPLRTEVQKVREDVESPIPEDSEVTEVMDPSPDLSEITEPLGPNVSEVIESGHEAREVMEPPTPEVSEVIESGHEAREVMEPPTPEVSEVIESGHEAREVMEPPKTSQNIVNIEGIELVYAETLKKMGIETTNDLLLAGTTPQDREELAKKTGVSSNLILKWVNLVDFFRIEGVGKEYSDLLGEAGVDTVVELAKKNPEKLHNKMKQINEEKNIVNRVPFLSEVFSWVEQAKALPRKVEY